MTRQSRPTTASPRASRAFDSAWPIKPAAPVTSVVNGRDSGAVDEAKSAAASLKTVESAGYRPFAPVFRLEQADPFGLLGEVMSARERILPPYTRRVDDLRHRVVRLVGTASVILLAILFGFVIGVFGMFGWFIPAIPVAILALVALWMAPDVGTDAESTQRIVPVLLDFFSAFAAQHVDQMHGAKALAAVLVETIHTRKGLARRLGGIPGGGGLAAVVAGVLVR